MTKTEEELAEMQVAKESLPMLELDLRKLHPVKDRVARQKKMDEIKLAIFTARGRKELGEKIVAKQQEGRAKRDAARASRVEE